MVYPDTRCWDQHGDIDPTGHDTKDGIVQTALREMINRLTAEPEDEQDTPDAQCEDYSSILQSADESLNSVIDFLAGERDDWIQY